jgi:hypothetical protein
MADPDKKGYMRGIRPKHVIIDEIPDYFSKDIQFDWPEPYEPPFPLTEAERRLQALNGLPASFTDYTHGRIRLVPLLPPEKENET